MALILFVEYHATFRQAASYLMDREPDLEVVAQGGSVAEGREQMARGGMEAATGHTHPPAERAGRGAVAAVRAGGGRDAAIVDIPLPDGGAEEMVRDLCGTNPSVPVLVMTHLEDRGVHESFLRAGAAEVLAKDVPFGEVLAAVRRLGAGGCGR